MRLHILGIGGTFMGGVALLARQAGHEVTGSDSHVYPPMSTQLVEQGIPFYEGYKASYIDPAVDCVIVGNIIRRGNPAMEHVLNNHLPYLSGPQWLAENVLKKRWVLGVAGTHGKTTTASLLAWILDAAGLAPGFLIGGIPENFGMSARPGKSPCFVIEADEYDTAFFDKRSKFIHYQSRTLALTNLEYDHADIFPDLEAIKQQFHHLVRTVPANGLIIRHAEDANLDDVLGRGCWTPVVCFAGSMGEWQAKPLAADGSAFTVLYQGKPKGEVHWRLLGKHNMENALAALAAAHHAGVEPEQAIRTLAAFKPVKRRLEIRGQIKNIVIYDDFAHHPTAIAATLSGLRAKIGRARLIAVLEFGSYSMRVGMHKNRMKTALQDADMVICKNTETDWGLSNLLKEFSQSSAVYEDVDVLVDHLVPVLQAGDHVVIMSNAGFGGIHQKLLEAMEKVE